MNAGTKHAPFRNDGGSLTLGLAAESHRNLRNFWLLGPDPFLAAHFATFPTEIPRRAILAGTSQAGCCPACGAGWVREREPSPEYAKLLGKAYHDHSGDGVQYGLRQNGKGPKNLGGMETYITTGWRQGCTCPPADPIPATVLDPFVGSGTAVMVAKQLMRRGIGIDLSAAYLELAKQRVRSVTAGVQLELDTDAATDPDADDDDD